MGTVTDGPVKKPITRDLDQAARNAAEDLLGEAGIWSFDSHGWSNAWDPNPEFIGHATWQVETPMDELREIEANTAPHWQRVIAIGHADRGPRLVHTRPDCHDPVSRLLMAPQTARSTIRRRLHRNLEAQIAASP